MMSKLFSILSQPSLNQVTYLLMFSAENQSARWTVNFAWYFADSLLFTRGTDCTIKTPGRWQFINPLGGFLSAMYKHNTHSQCFKISTPLLEQDTHHFRGNLNTPAHTQSCYSLHRPNKQFSKHDIHISSHNSLKLFQQLPLKISPASSNTRILEFCLSLPISLRSDHS